MGHLKKKKEIRTSALSNSSMEISWKRKKGEGGEKEGSVRKGNTSELSVRNFVIVFLSLTQVEVSLECDHLKRCRRSGHHRTSP